MESKKEDDINIFNGEKRIISSEMTYENISKEDINIINKYIIPKENNYWNNFPINGLSYKIKNFQNLIYKKTNFIKNIETAIKSDSSFSPKVNINQKFINKKIYMSPIEYFYYIKPNAIQGRLNYYIKKFNNESSLGVEYVQRRSKNAFFLQNMKIAKLA